MSLRVLPPIPAVAVRAHGTDEVRREVQRRLKATALGGEMAPPRRFVPGRDGYWDGYAYEIDPEFPELAAQIAEHRAGREHGRGGLATHPAQAVHTTLIDAGDGTDEELAEPSQKDEAPRTVPEALTPRL